MTAAPDVDFSDPDFLADPYPTLAELRDRGPMLWHEPDQVWLATTHEAVSQTLRNRSLGRLWSDWEPAEAMEPFNSLHRNQMMENEPPAHTRMRRLVAGAFARGHVERMRPRVEAIARRLLDALTSDGTTDILGGYAEPLPVLVIADLLGVPGVDHARLRAWSQAIVRMYEHDVGPETRHAATEASTAFSAYVREVIAERRCDLRAGRRGADLISDLIDASEDGGRRRLTDDELVASVVLLLNAGHEASVNTFGNGIHALLAHPQELERVASGDVDVATAIEELIRFDPPLQLFERTATKDTQIAGQRVQAGQRVAALMGSANRDVAVFDRADQLDLLRDPNPHVGFGMGVHFCLGAPLARMELQISLFELLARHPRLRLVRPAPRRPTFVLRGYERIDVDLHTPVGEENR